MAIGDPRSWMWAEACALIEQAERLNRRFFEPVSAGTRPAGWEPPADVFETEWEYWVIVALPGVEPQDVELSLENRVLLIAGRRRLLSPRQAAAIHRIEIPHGWFERRLRLPAEPLAIGRREIENGCLVLQLTKQP